MTVSRDVGYIRVGNINMCNVHSTPRVLVLSRLTFRATVTMEEEQFQRLLDAISALQKEVMAGQESFSQEVVEKIQKRSYQFRRKSNKEQFKFNASVDEHLGAAKKQLSKLEPRTEEENNTIARSKAHLDEGMKKIAVRQKHIKIANRSDLGWAVIEAYMDELASDSDDERRLYKANREAQQAVKRKKTDSAATAAKRRVVTASVEPPGRLGNQGTRPPAVARLWMVGPCY